MAFNVVVATSRTPLAPTGPLVPKKGPLWSQWLGYKMDSESSTGDLQESSFCRNEKRLFKVEPLPTQNALHISFFVNPSLTYFAFVHLD